MNKFILALSIFLCGTLFTTAQNNIEVEIENFSSNKGMALVALYNSEATFLKKELKGEIVPIQNNKVLLTFKDLPDGNYAVSVVHDEDENNELTTNFIGIPKESYGSSNNAPARFGPPKWKDARFEVKNNATVKQKITL